jgi:hypothetical protein
MEEPLDRNPHPFAFGRLRGRRWEQSKGKERAKSDSVFHDPEVSEMRVG